MVPAVLEFAFGAWEAVVVECQYVNGYLLEGLNPAQRQAVLHAAGPLVVFAGAGSGKTRVITHRVAHLVHGGMPPWRILAVTFTNRAAGEMRERLEGLLGPAARDLWVGTFHATCARLLRKYAEQVGVRRDFTIYDDQDQKALLARILQAEGLDDRRFPLKLVAARINRAKQEALAPEDLPGDDPFNEQISTLYALYEAGLSRCGALDFGDLIYRLVAALERDEALRNELQGRFEHVLVDEFQDTNHVQYRLLRALCAGHRNLCVVGDDDQSIYRWRGADRRNILDFRDEFPGAEVVKLEQNYRSTQRILRVAHAVIARNVDREPKELWTENTEGPRVLSVRCDDERDEARMMVRAVRELGAEGRSLADMVVFYRIHAQSRVLEEALRAANVPYQVVGGMRFYDRAEVKDALAYLRAIHNPDDDVSLLRVINTPARCIGKSTIERLLDLAARRGSGVWGALEAAVGEGALGGAVARKLEPFVGLVRGLRQLVAEGVRLSELGEAVVERTGYAPTLRNEDTPEADARLMNLKELVGSLAEFEEEAEDPSLATFLELVSLQSSVDEMGAEGDRLTLMTVHAAKGLEFPVVMVAGLEEGMFPFRGFESDGQDEELEEERRLAYVAMTRAKDRLILSWANVRRVFGQTRQQRASRFLSDMPEADVEWLGGRPGSRAATPAWHTPAWQSPAWQSPVSQSPAGPPPAPTETYVDHSEGDFADAVPQRGMRVRHAKFGVGRVREVGDGLPPRVTVEFPGWGVKRVVASFLEPA
jgi:DNA helicase II / ATP-dependent DNA helicase PcrA